MLFQASPSVVDPFAVPVSKAKTKARLVILRCVVFGLALFSLMMPGHDALARSGPDGFSDLAERLLPAVVNISSTQNVKTAKLNPHEEQGLPQFPPGSPFEEFFKDFFDRQGRNPNAPARKAISLGSGFIIDPSGLIVTNNHVIADSNEITVILQDDTNLKATVVGRDTKTDLALLKVDAKKKLTSVAFGDSDKARVGDWVLAIGDPFGLGGTVTAGILSARARDIGNGPYDDFLQTDAPINKGNSGGPMFNMSGEVIGINTAIYSPSGGSVGIGFAIPSALAKEVVDQLKTGGKVKRGWLGAKVQTVTKELADNLGLPKAEGALVASVSDDSPAAKAKIKPGDVVLKFDGKDITDMRKLPRYVAETPINKTVSLTLWRKNAEVPVQVTIGQLSDNDAVASADGGDGGDQPNATSVPALGLKLSSLTPALKDQYGLGDDASGVVVTDATPNSTAAEKGISPGDVIVEVEQDEVKTPADVVNKIKAKQEKLASQGKGGKKDDNASDGGKAEQSVLLLVEKKGEVRYVVVPFGKA